jgi:hypothetical protein
MERQWKCARKSKAAARTKQAGVEDAVFPAGDPVRAGSPVCCWYDLESCGCYRLELLKTWFAGSIYY